MCVAVTLDPGADLTLEELKKMDATNRDGVGMAWIDERGAVSWWKTTKVDPEEVRNRLQFWADSPRLLHFRLSTAGGTRPELCHPFPIGPTAICSPEGSAWTAMIHNGHWHRWQEVHSLLKDEDLLPDKGPWSDTRLIAYLAHSNKDWLQALGGRVATLEHTGAIVRLGDWQELRTGIYVSNKIWEHYSERERKTYSYRTEPHSHTQASTYLATQTWDGDTDECRVPGIGKAKALPKGRHDEAEKPKKKRHYVLADWQDPDTKRWFRWDEKTDAVVDVTAEHHSSAK